MNHFFRSFFAALLALVVFFGFFLLIGLVLVAAVSASRQTGTGDHAVLAIDLSEYFPEVESANPLGLLTSSEKGSTPSLHTLVRLIRHAKEDPAVKGVYIRCGKNNNDLAASEEIREALLDFRSSGKFIYAYAAEISQRGYFVASAADKIYCHPKGGLSWNGFSMQTAFLKGMLDKLEIEPQVFFAGKFKSATEPFRETRMTEANRLQSTELLNDLYRHFLQQVSLSRNIDTATLRRYADSNAVQFASEALAYGMVDGLKFDDEVRDELRAALGIDSTASLNLVTPGKYEQAANLSTSGNDQIAVIYADGSILEGSGDRGMIGSETYRRYIQKARMNKSVGAIVLRINSGGGSAMAGEIIWREVDLARQQKPVVVSFGDVAASGGYYMACAADSIFAQPNTITGSIGVFALLPNMQDFFHRKLGITFDGVETSAESASLSVVRPLSAVQKQYVQDQIDTIYATFIDRVSAGRKKEREHIDSIAQGRVWSGTRAVELGLVDRLGGLDDALAAAAAKAGIKDYRLREYPGKPDLLDMLLRDKTDKLQEAGVREQLGQEMYRLYQQLNNVRQLAGSAQARLPFDLYIE